MAEYADPVDPREGLIEYAAFTGLRNNVSPESFSRGDLVTALNVDLDDAGGISRRKGYSAPVAASVDRSLWASGPVCLGVGSNALKLVYPDYTTKTLMSGLTASRALSYAAVGDRVFWSNGVELGCVQNGANRSWGITPPGLPAVSAGPGTLAAGKYQVAVTYLRDDLQESGTGMAVAIELTAVGGLSLSSIPVSTDATITHKIIYAAPVGGEVLYSAGGIANADTTFLIDEVRVNASPLATQFLSPPPAGDYIAYWKGWMLVANGNRLYPSEPYAPELFDLRKSVPFLDSITMLAPLLHKGAGGVWLGTGTQIVFVSGESPEQWVYQPAAEYGVIPGTLAYGDGELIGDASMKGVVVAFFATKQGLCVGLPDGSLVNLTQGKYAYPVQERGAGVVRRHRGIAQFLVTMQGSETAGNVAA
ncbi:MAG: hypothetical protein NUW01_01360 [Gemmatimonadaceae bacterium]|nr:hypothetical protein [Gemmatimonadaceae bacterium]